MEKYLISGCILYFACIFTISSAVKIRTFYVPGKAGNEAPLLCTYDLETDVLYDVKWYKDGEQFFRCEPNGITTAFPVDGVKVQHIKFAPLGSCSLTLMMLTQKTAGEYRCEVNTEGPKFDTASESRKMLIIEPHTRRQMHNFTKPENKPSIINNTIINYQQDAEIVLASNGTSPQNMLLLLYASFLLVLKYIY